MKVTSEHIQTLIETNNPDGYWLCESLEDRAKYLQAKIPYDRAVLQTEYHLLEDPLYRVVAWMIQCLYNDFNEIFLLYHKKENWGKSWDSIYPARQVEHLVKKLQYFSEMFIDYPLLQHMLGKIIEVVHSSETTSHVALSSALIQLSTELIKSGLPPFFAIFDDYLSGQNLTTHLEPNVMLVKPIDTYNDLIRTVHAKILQLSNTNVDESASGQYVFAAQLVAWAGWTTATKGYGINLDKNTAILLPDLYKYTQQVKRVAEYFGVHMTYPDIYRCVMRYLSGHEDAHQFGEAERIADRLAISASIELASQVGKEEIVLQIITLLVEMGMPLTMAALSDYERGYHASSIIALEEFKGSGILEEHHGTWSIHPNRADTLVARMLSRSTQNTDQEVILTANKTHQVLANFILGAGL